MGLYFANLKKTNYQEEKMLVDMKINEFLDMLASNAPAPGGGSAAALSGAISAGLVSMVCNLTIGKKGYEDVAEKIKTLLERSEELRAELTKLIDLDTEAFNGIMAAMKLPKETDEQKSVRKEAIQAATKKATQVPMKTMEFSLEILELAREVAEIGNRNAVSDAGVSASLAYAAMESALFNIRINLGSIKDEVFVEEIEERSEDLMDEADELFEEVSDILDSKLETE